jgi:hypothetical protein
MSKLKNEVDQITKPYARSAMLSGIWCLLLFILHFGLYSRPTEEEKQQQQSNNEFEPRPVYRDSIDVEMQQRQSVPQASADSVKYADVDVPDSGVKVDEVNVEI